jgi:hypothetical protein
MSVNIPISHSISDLLKDNTMCSNFNSDYIVDNSENLYDSYDIENDIENSKSEEETTDNVESEEETTDNVESEEETTDNVESEEESEEESTDNDMPELVSDDSYDSNEDIEEDIEKNNKNIEMIYLIEVDDKVVTYGTTVEDVDGTVKYIIENLSNKYKLSGFNNVYKDNILKITNDNKVVTNVYGTRCNSIIQYEQILFTVSIHIVPKYTKLIHDKIKYL